MIDVEFEFPTITPESSPEEIAAAEAEADRLITEHNTRHRLSGDASNDVEYKVENYNENHDEATGRFSSGTGSIQSVVQTGFKRDIFKPNGAKDFPNEKDMGEYINSYHNGMPELNQYEAMNVWVGADGCTDMQNYIRVDSKDSYIKQFVDGLDDATNTHTLKDDVNLYRGMATSKAYIDKMAREGSFNVKTFFTTGLNAERVENFFSGHTAGYDSETGETKEPTMFRIKAKKGTKGVFVDSRYPGTDYHNGLGEFVPSRDNTYKVVNVTHTETTDGKYSGSVVDLETE